MTYILAVSGGVDSVVMLHMLANRIKSKIIVAHFDHGIRSDSAEDAEFVRTLAHSYRLQFEVKREELGVDAGEDLARNRRYFFLRSLSKKYNGRIVTAHHADDMVETVAINIHRGTGWRGLAVLDSDVVRPMLKLSKSDIYAYAIKNQLEWREDSTNDSFRYLRNRIRLHTQSMNEDARKEIALLREGQIRLKNEIEHEVVSIFGAGPDYKRYLINHVPVALAEESLRVLTKGLLTRPQLKRLTLAIKTARPNSVYEAGGGVIVRFTTRHFYLELLK